MFENHVIAIDGQYGHFLVMWQIFYIRPVPALLVILLTYVLYSRGGLGRRASTKERQGIRVIRLRAICLISYQDFRFPAISHLTPPHITLMQPLRAHGIYLAP